MRSAIAIVLIVVLLSGCLTPRGNETNGTLSTTTSTEPGGTQGTTESPAPANTTTGTTTASTPPPREPETHEVQITDALLCTDAAFRPATIGITVGDAVVWHNDDDCTHTASGRGGSFETGNLEAGESSGPIRFDEAGTFEYICALHPQMTGTVNVSEA